MFCCDFPSDFFCFFPSDSSLTVRDLIRQRDYLTKKIEAGGKESKKLEAANRSLRSEMVSSSNQLTEEINGLRRENKRLNDELTEVKVRQTWLF